MKKILALLLAITLSFSLLTLAIAAAQEKTESLVVFGDSISTGYRLDGTLYTRASYANTVAAALGLSEGNGYVNHAVDGYTSANILSKAKAYSADVAGADLILLTCGGNDVLGLMLNIALTAINADSTNLLLAIRQMASIPAEEINARLYSEANNAAIDQALATYEANMTELVAYLRATAPDAQIVFLTQYNPLSGISFAAVLDAYAEYVIGQLNNLMYKTVEAGGCQVIDTHAVMVGKGLSMSNILSSDIHPNATGHAAMAEMIKQKLKLGTYATETTTEITTTEPVVSTTEPVVTTTEPVVTTTEPVVTTTEPIVTTTEPVVTTTEPVVTTTEPVVTTTVTTTAPIATTTTATTTAPITTTTATEKTTVMAAVTTTEPVATTSVPEEIPPVDLPEVDPPVEPGDDDASAGALAPIIIAVALVAVGVIVTVVAIVIRKKR